MRALTWQGKRKVSVEEVPDPTISEPTDAIIRITTTNICGSDLHLYETLGPFMTKGDVLGHEPMGIVEEVGSAVTNLAVGDRVVIPFQIACGSCWMCSRGLPTQCETTQVREQGSGAQIFGYSKLYGSVPGGQAEYLRVPQAQFTSVKVPHGPADERFVYLSDVLPTAWQAVEYAAVPDGGTLVVLGLGPIGDMACRIGQHKGFRVIGVDRVAERLQRGRDRGYEVVDMDADGDLGERIRDLTDGRGPDSVVDAVGMEAHDSPVTKLMQQAGSAPSTPRSTSCGAAAPSRCPASTAAWPTRCRCSRCSTSRSSCGWARPTSSAGWTRSCRCSPMPTRSASTPSTRTRCRSSRRRRCTTPSRRRRTAA